MRWFHLAVIVFFAAATIVLRADRFRYFLEGNSTAEARKIRLRNNTKSFSMANMISNGTPS